MSLHAKPRSGFALLITIVLVAFLVLILVGLAAFTRVETQVASNAQTVARAKANSLMALNIAIGRLSETAGRDQRITATGDGVAAAQATNPFWTAVWSNEGGTLAANPQWLVSGANANPATNLSGSGNAVRLVGTNTAGSATARHVFAEMQDVSAEDIPGVAGAARIGRFAWWVGDEGVKASIALEDATRATASRTVPTFAGGVVADARQRERVGRLIAARGGPDAIEIFELGPENANDTNLSSQRWTRVGDVVTRNQFDFTLAHTTALRTRFREAYHAVTPTAYGVLSNTQAGGLRRNLTFDPSPDSAFINDLNVPRVSSVTSPRLTPTAGTAGVNAPAVAPKPIITEIALDVIPFRQDSPGGIAAAPVRIGYRLRMEFWNPYALPMAHVAAVGADDYRVRVTGLPTLTFSAPLQTVQPAPADYNLAELITPTTDLVVELNADLLPGQFNRRSQNPVFLGNLPTAVTPVIVFDATPGGGTVLLADDRLSYSWPAGALRFEIYRNDGSTTPIQIIENVRYPAGQRDGTTNWFIAGNNAFSGTAFTSTAHFNKGIVFHAAVDESFIADWQSLIAPDEGDLVSPGVYPPDLRAASVSWDDGYFDSVGVDPADNADLPASLFPSVGFFQFQRQVVLSDVSVQPQLSLGQLMHAGVPGARPFAFGNPWGGALNNLFDEGFLLPVDTGWTDADLLPNPRYRPFRPATPVSDLRNVEAARHVLVAGMFNVNSTNAASWAGFLGRSTEVTAGGVVANTTVRNPAFFFTNTADLVTAANVPAIENRGFTGLTPQQLTDLATRIATAVRLRSTPFTSVADFLNSGVVADAIEDNMANASGTTRINQGVTPYSPSYLTQAGLLNPLIPFLAVRSDTFTIRVCGESINPVTDQPEARVYAEAVVQRLPDPLDATIDPNPMDNSAAGSLGRRFVVTSFRWLTADDI